jgi:hypothetical protein
VADAGAAIGVDVPGLHRAHGKGPLTRVVGRMFSPACYIDGSFPSLLYMAYAYADDPEAALIGNTNAGGENCHRCVGVPVCSGRRLGVRRRKRSRQRERVQSHSARAMAERVLKARRGRVDTSSHQPPPRVTEKREQRSQPPLLLPSLPHSATTRSLAPACRGAALGALMGLTKGMASWPRRWVEGLYPADEIQAEARALAAAALSDEQQHGSGAAGAVGSVTDACGGAASAAIGTTGTVAIAGDGSGQVGTA